MLSLLACTTQPLSKQTPLPSVDMPTLASQDVISIAQQHSVTSPLNIYEKAASIYARKGGTQGWVADYTGNGKWVVELLISNDEKNLTVYRWTVLEAQLNALFIGAYNESLIKYKLQYGHYPK
jgi:hypothetical protein